MKKWNENSAKAAIERNGGEVSMKEIHIASAPGIKVWGAIDFLTNHCGYLLFR